MAPPLGGEPQPAPAPAPALGRPAVLSTHEFVVRIPRPSKRAHHLMRFRTQPGQRPLNWTKATMVRENNQIEHIKTETEDRPKFGAGSEYARDLKDEARRRRYTARKKYDPDNEPWQLQIGGKRGRKYRGVREGGINENTSYYIFVKSIDGAFEAYPIEQWYNFAPVQLYKALSVEEAEDAYNKRDKIINHFALMVRKRLAEAEGKETDDNEVPDANGGSISGRYGSRNRDRFKLSDMDDSVPRSDGSSADSESEESEEATAKKRKKRRNEKKKDKKAQEGDVSAKEDSDEGDFEHREVDYITSGSDSSDDEPEDVKANKQMKGVEDEDALRLLVVSDEDDEDEQDDENKKEEEANEAEKADDNNSKQAATLHESGKPTDDEKVLKVRKSKKGNKKVGGTSDASSSSSSDSDIDEVKVVGSSAIFMIGKNNTTQSGNTPAQSSPLKSTSSKPAGGQKEPPATGRVGVNPLKRDRSSTSPTKTSISPVDQQQSSPASSAPAVPAIRQPPKKRARLESQRSSPSGNDDRQSVASPTPRTDRISPAVAPNEGLNEETIRRYLTRKPMTTTDLLQKLKSRKGDLSSVQLVSVVTDILKRINPKKQNINGRLHLYIEE